jgi:hypothetical protein
MAKRGPCARNKSLRFASPTCSLFLEEKDALCQAMVELGLPDDMKVQRLSFLFNLGLLVVDTNLFVKLQTPHEARTIAFAIVFPVTVRLISVCDNLLSCCRERALHLARMSDRKLKEERKCVILHLAEDVSAVFPAADVANDDASASIIDSMLVRPSVLFVGNVFCGSCQATGAFPHACATGQDCQGGTSFQHSCDRFQSR